MMDSGVAPRPYFVIRHNTFSHNRVWSRRGIQSDHQFRSKPGTLSSSANRPQPSELVVEIGGTDKDRGLSRRSIPLPEAFGKSLSDAASYVLRAFEKTFAPARAATFGTAALIAIEEGLPPCPPS